MVEIAICHKVANNLSYYNAAEGSSWREEADKRAEAREAWAECRLWLYRQGKLKEFLQAGNYLISTPDWELQAAREAHERLQPLEV